MEITPGDADALVAGRVKRQEILYQPGRNIDVIVGEAALRNTPATVATLLGQLDRLISFAELRDACATGPEAVGLIRHVIDELRG